MSNKKDLGKGIRALLENIGTESAEEEGLVSVGSPRNTDEILLEQIEINPFQPRADFDAHKLEELAESIKLHGLIQPITVRRLENRKYQLIAGERRLRAAKIAGLKSVPAYIRTADDEEMLVMALIENIQREDLNAIEIAINYKRLIDEGNLTQEELAAKVGKDRTTVTNYLRLLKLPPQIQVAIKQREISMGHARALINLENVDEQLHVYKEIIKHGLSVRKVEEMVRQMAKPATRKPAPARELTVQLKRIEQHLSSQLGTRVHLKPKKGGKGEIVIQWFSEEDLERILELLEGHD